MFVEWLLLGEGITQDSRGAFAIVGLNQNVTVADSLPAQTKRSILAHVTGAENGAELDFRIAVTAPSGRVLNAQQGSLKLAGSRFASLPPAGIDIPAEFIVNLVEYGTHMISVEVTDNEERVTSEKTLPLYVVPPSELG